MVCIMGHTCKNQIRVLACIHTYIHDMPQVKMCASLHSPIKLCISLFRIFECFEFPIWIYYFVVTTYMTCWWGIAALHLSLARTQSRAGTTTSMHTLYSCMHMHRQIIRITTYYSNTVHSSIDQITKTWDYSNSKQWDNVKHFYNWFVELNNALFLPMLFPELGWFSNLDIQT